MEITTVGNEENNNNPLTYSVGEKDIHGNEISKIYFKNSSGFVIYRSTNNQGICVIRQNKLSDIDCNIIGKVIEIEGLIGKETNAEKYYSTLARAINQCYLGHNDTADLIITDLKNSIKKSRIKNGRLEYFFGATLGVMLLVILVAINEYIYVTTGHKIKEFDLCMYGAMGSYFSIALSLPKIEINILESDNYYFLTGLMRVLIGIISALIIFRGICGDLFLGTIKTNWHALCFISFLSGFSESFLPNMLKRVNAEIDNTK